MKTTAMKMVAGLALAAAVPMTASAAMSGNIGYTSNYLWRGQTQTNDQAAISGGIDYSHDSGFYVGLWTSNVSWTTPVGSELDTYLGYSGEAGGFSYDIGYINYGYPQTVGAADFSEVYVGGGYGPVSLTYSMDSKNETSYMDLSASFDLSDKVGMGVHYGSGTEGTYGTDYSVTLTSGDFSFGLSSWADGPDDAAKAMKPFVSYSQSFDF
jgi:uncharacterized protein (TIGR02001 family)